MRHQADEVWPLLLGVSPKMCYTRLLPFRVGKQTAQRQSQAVSDLLELCERGHQQPVRQDHV